MADTSIPNGFASVVPWPEQPMPEWADPARLCPLVHGSHRLVWGEGNTGGPVTVILDNPGLRERGGAAFVCGTRQTLRDAMTMAALSPEDVFIAFLFKARPCGAYDREAAYRTFVPILAEQIAASPARCLVALGNTVVRGLFGLDAKVKALRGQWLEWAGRPLRVGYHPLAVRRRPNLMPLLIEDLVAAHNRIRAEVE